MGLVGIIHCPSKTHFPDGTKKMNREFSPFDSFLLDFFQHNYITKGDTLYIMLRYFLVTEPLEVSVDIRSIAALSALLNFCWTCWTQSRPTTSIRAIIRGSVSDRLLSNSFRVSNFSLVFHGWPLVSSTQWKAKRKENVTIQYVNNDQKWYRHSYKERAFSHFCGNVWVAGKW